MPLWKYYSQPQPLTSFQWMPLCCLEAQPTCLHGCSLKCNMEPITYAQCFLHTPQSLALNTAMNYTMVHLWWQESTCVQHQDLALRHFIMNPELCFDCLVLGRGNHNHLWQAWVRFSFFSTAGRYTIILKKHKKHFEQRDLLLQQHKVNI